MTLTEEDFDDYIDQYDNIDATKIVIQLKNPQTYEEVKQEILTNQQIVERLKLRRNTLYNDPDDDWGGMIQEFDDILNGKSILEGKTE